ncbi:MAG: hypothetical protein IKB04_08390 [Clostridia bacterium]|nr:hypothetical protein [Clostridia bacterium]
MRCRTCNGVCNTVGLIVGALVGIGAGLLFFYEQLPGFAAAVPALFVLGAVTLGVLLVGLSMASCRAGCAFADCLVDAGVRLTVGALGTVITAWLFPVFTLFTVQLILAALLAFFATYLTVQLVCFVACLTRRACD